MYEGSEDEQLKRFQFSALRVSPLTQIQAVASCYFGYGLFFKGIVFVWTYKCGSLTHLLPYISVTRNSSTDNTFQFAWVIFNFFFRTQENIFIQKLYFALYSFMCDLVNKEGNKLQLNCLWKLDLKFMCDWELIYS
jgi:hypothetical protein